MKNSNHFFNFFIEMMADIPEKHLSNFEDLLNILLSMFSDRIKDNNVKFENERLYYSIFARNDYFKIDSLE